MHVVYLGIRGYEPGLAQGLGPAPGQQPGPGLGGAEQASR